MESGGRFYFCFLEGIEHQHQFEYVAKAIEVAPIDPREVLPLPAVESQAITSANHGSFAVNGAKQGCEFLNITAQ